MLRYDDLPALQGTQELAVQATQVRSMFLQAINKTQRHMIADIGRGTRSIRSYHQRSEALRLSMQLYCNAGWWTRPFEEVQADLLSCFDQVMDATYTLVAGIPHFLFSARSSDFAQLLAPLAINEIYLATWCAVCGNGVTRVARENNWITQKCCNCIPTNVLPPVPATLTDRARKLAFA